MIKITPFIYKDEDDLYANTYVLSDEDNNAIVIDPAKADNSLVSFLKRNGFNLKAVLLTHAHIDHSRGTPVLINEFDCDYYLFKEEYFALRDPILNAIAFIGGSFDLKKDPILLNDGQEIDLLAEKIKVIWTPYHTKGSCCYYLKDSDALFTGDFLFKGSVGRSDFSNSCPKEFNKSISKILCLPDSTKIYPGHGNLTTLQSEKQFNCFIR